MALDVNRSEGYLKLVDVERGLVDRRIFVDQDIYRMELENIFARAWNFMAHDSQIPEPGDFFLSFIGEDRVIVVRDKELQPQVLVNSCRHRGNAVCRPETGHVSSFMCTYHGWTYDLNGALVGVPGFKEIYHEALDRENWGLIKAAQVETYKGFIFASMDPDAPSLWEFLGDVGRMGLDYLTAHGEIEIIPGIQKFTMDCNWKFAVDNVWDFYHGDITHASSGMSGYNSFMGRVPPTGHSNMFKRLALNSPHLVVMGEYGHAVSGPRSDSPPGQAEPLGGRKAPPDTVETREILGKVGMKLRGHDHIFPNIWIWRLGAEQVTLRLPKGPTKTEIWRFGFLPKGISQEERATCVNTFNRGQGPAGMAEMDDGENWHQSTLGSVGVVGQRYPYNYSMGQGYDSVTEDEFEPPSIETGVNEHAQLWYYRNWAEWMHAESWPSLKSNHSPVPRGSV